MQDTSTPTTPTTPDARKAPVKNSPMLERLLAHGVACRRAGAPEAKPVIERALRLAQGARKS